MNSELIARYFEPHRKYHNWGHITDMLKNTETFLPLIFGDTLSLYENINLIESILYHDVIYNLHDMKNNEILSAKFYADSRGVPMSHPVPEMILATKEHFTEKNFSPLTSFLMDMDVLSFNLSYGDFYKVNKRIDSEFLNIMTWDELKVARTKFLKDIVKNKSFRFRILPYDTSRAYDNLSKIITEEYT